MQSNPLLHFLPHLPLFEQKIILTIARNVSNEDANTKAYCFRLIDFELDCLNPSDITARLKGLRNRTIRVWIDGDMAAVPLLTDIRYDDRNKRVTITFNSVLKSFYVHVNESLKNEPF